MMNENLQNKQVEKETVGRSLDELSNWRQWKKLRNVHRKQERKRKKKRFKNDFSLVVLSDWHFKIII